MFDISFTELMVIGVIALIVIGPERLPKVARTVGHLLGRAQRYVNDVKSDIRREVELDELRNLRNEMQDAARSFETSIHREVDDVRAGVAGVTESINQTGRDIAEAASADLAGPPARQAPDVTAAGSLAADPHAADAPPADPDLQLELPLDERSAAGVAPAAAAPVPPVITQEKPGP